MKKFLFFQLICLFLVTQVLGLIIAMDFIKSISTGEMEQPTLFTEDKEAVENAVFLFAYIIFLTAFLLILLKFIKGWLFFKALEIVIVFVASLIFFSVFLPSVSFLFTVLIVALRLSLPESVFLRNISSIICVSAIGALIGISMGVLPVLIFIILLAIYDVVAVFGTKHMVTIAKAVSKKNLAFTFALPTPKHQFELGTGDIVIPLVFGVSVMNSNAYLGFPFYLVGPAMVLLGSLIGLILTIAYSSKHVGRALPALPPQAILMIAMYALSKAIGF